MNIDGVVLNWMRVLDCNIAKVQSGNVDSKMRVYLRQGGGKIGDGGRGK
jgi:hypothetical protein